MVAPELQRPPRLAAPSPVHYQTAMAQVKVYGLRKSLEGRKQVVSDAIHSVVMEVLGLPAGKRAHRFFPLEADDFFMPDGRSEAYVIIEVLVMTGRTQETRKRLVRRLYDELEKCAGLPPVDVEICIIESPPENWGFRGLHGDEAKLPYEVRR
jgi:phenylpyruvate tautomerase PptA (4-oxalocrotonate tautomerase family)